MANNYDELWKQKRIWHCLNEPEKTHLLTQSSFVWTQTYEIYSTKVF